MVGTPPGVNVVLFVFGCAVTYLKVCFDDFVWLGQGSRVICHFMSLWQWHSLHQRAHSVVDPDALSLENTLSYSAPNHVSLMTDSDFLWYSLSLMQQLLQHVAAHDKAMR